MKYQWLVSSVTIEGIEVAVGQKVLGLTRGSVVTGYYEDMDDFGNPTIFPILTSDSLEIEFYSELTTSQKAKLTAYLRIATRETLTKRTW